MTYCDYSCVFILLFVIFSWFNFYLFRMKIAVMITTKITTTQNSSWWLIPTGIKGDYICWGVNNKFSDLQNSTKSQYKDIFFQHYFFYLYFLLKSWFISFVGYIWAIFGRNLTPNEISRNNSDIQYVLIFHRSEYWPKNNVIPMDRKI